MGFWLFGNLSLLFTRFEKDTLLVRMARSSSSIVSLPVPPNPIPVPRIKNYNHKLSLGLLHRFALQLWFWCGANSCSIDPILLYQNTLVQVLSEVREMTKPIHQATASFLLVR